jgi:hypothetical protein
MLTESQLDQVWERKLAAEVRSLYFGDFASRYSRRKQAITFVTFFLSSGAAATLIGKAPSWVPIMLSVMVAILTAYSVAIGLERLVRTMAKLHYSWNQIATDYDRLFNHTGEDEAESEFQELLRRERDASELATTEVPNNQKIMGEWQDYVVRQYHLDNA